MSKIIKLTPPKICRESILKEIICTRPMRDGCFNISREKKESKEVIHCYGHGGSGWTTLWGSVERALELFEEDPPSKKTPIRVVGTGCMGLTLAIELKRRGYLVSGIATKDLFDIASWRAASYFAFVSVKTSDKELDNQIAIGISTFKAYSEIAKGEHAYISKEAVHLMPVYCSEETDSGLKELETHELVPPHERVTIDFGNGAKHERYLQCMTYFTDTTMMMKELHKEVKRLSIPIEIREVESFEEIDEPFIINCTGVGAKLLNKDRKLIPVRGHLILLNEKAGKKHLDYMIYTTVMQDGKEEYVYLFPKVEAVSSSWPSGVSSHGIIGGSFIPNAEKATDDLETLDRREFDRMLDRNSLFFTGKPFKE